MNLNLKGKTVIVTGGGSNIGRGISLAFAEEGANVVIAELDEAQGKKVVEEAKAKGATGAVVIKTDVTNWDSVKAMVDATLKKFGKIDVLVNNVGWAMDRLFVEQPREEWEKEIAINYWGPINCTRAVLDHMIERKYGRLVYIGSDAGRMGEYRESVYAGCKGATIALAKSLARENGRYGITFNTVCPGATIPKDPAKEAGEGSMWAKSSPVWQIFTPEALEKTVKGYPLRRLGTPQDIANAVVFLASDAAGYITGQTLSVSGGYTMM